jgi:hypothetical protein
MMPHYDDDWLTQGESPMGSRGEGQYNPINAIETMDVFCKKIHQAGEVAAFFRAAV